MSDEMANVDEFLLQNKPIVPKLFDPAAQARRIPKLVLIDRLQAAGLFEAALTVLKSNPLRYERWQASTSVDPQSEDVQALLTAIGSDVDEVLAGE